MLRFWGEKHNNTFKSNIMSIMKTMMNMMMMMRMIIVMNMMMVMTSLMRAKRVVVKWTVPSSSIGWFILETPH